MSGLIKKIIGFGIVIVILLAVSYQFLVKPVQQMDEESDEIRTAPVETGDVIDRLKLAGQIVATKNVPIFPETGGQVIKIHVDEGDLVEEGDLLVELDQSQLLDQIDTKRMEMKKSVITLDNVKQEHERKVALFAEKFIPELELIEAKKMLDLAEIDNKLAKKELDALEKQMGVTTITSPIHGVVTTAKVEDGEMIKSKDQDAEGKLLFMITDLSSKGIELKVSEVERAHLKRGQIVEFFVQTNPGQMHQGKILKIAAAATETEYGSSSNQFLVQAEILGDPEGLNLGASVHVQVIVAEANDSIRVPSEAVFYDGQQKFVYVQKRGKFEKQIVTTGVSSTHYVEIKGGLQPNTQVALEEPLI